MRYTKPPILVRSRRLIGRVRQSLSPFVYVALAVAATIDLIRVTYRPVFTLIGKITGYLEGLPKWTNTLVGLFIVVVIIGTMTKSAYLLLESLYLRFAFGRSAMGTRLRRLAKADFLLSIDAVEFDLGITRPYAVILAILSRFKNARSVVGLLRNVQYAEADSLYVRTLDNIRQGWIDGLQGSVLVDHLTILTRLPVPAEPLRIRGQVVAANITYLLGDLHEGKRLADRTMSEAEEFDTAKLPLYQWLASYAHANSRLFLGLFDEAATFLGERWQMKYMALSAADRVALMTLLKSHSTLNPIASVGRHILLASAFSGRAIVRRETQPLPLTLAADTGNWALAWYENALTYGADERISQDFAHAYMALYCITVEPVLDPLNVLARVPADAPPASQYALHGVRGVVLMQAKKYEEALTDLRRADAYSRMSGNRFLEGILLPAHAAVAGVTDPTHMPEAKRMLRRAKLRTRLARSGFYDSQVDAAGAVIALNLGKDGEAKRLWARAQRTPNGMLQLYPPIKSERPLLGLIP